MASAPGGYAGQPVRITEASNEEVITGQDFLGKASTYARTGNTGVVGLLAYDVSEPLTEEEYDKWLFDIHYHDLLANPHLDKLVLHTVSKNKKAKLSSGASVTNKVEFFRLAELHFRDFDAYDKYVEWFQENVIPPPRTPAGKSAFQFYLLSESEAILRTTVPAAKPKVPLSTKGPTVLVVGSTGNIGTELVRQLKERGGVAVLEAGRSDRGPDGVQLDIYDVESVKALDGRLPDGIDHVVVCCGASIFGPIANFDSTKWEQNCGNKFVAISRLIIMLANGQEVKCLRDKGSITVTTGQASRTVNKMWPGIAANNSGLEAMVMSAGVDAPRGVRINSVSPALVYESAVKAGLPTEGTVSAADVGAAYLPIIFGDMTGQVIDAGSQTVFKKSHHAGQKDGVKNSPL